MQPYPSHPQAGAIGVELVFGVLHRNGVLSTNVLLRKYNTEIEIDGIVNERGGGAWHVFQVAPGWHLVRVFFRVRPSFIARDTGSRQLQVFVHPGTMARLKYEDSLLWPLTGATLVQTG